MSRLAPSRFESTRSAFLRNDTGVTALEAAILMPFFLMLVYGIIYLALYLSVQGILDTAASRALTEVTTGADFESAQENGPPDCTGETAQTLFCQRSEAVLADMRTLAASAFVRPNSESGGIAYLNSENPENPRVVWPATSAVRGYEQVLQNEPITVTVEARLRTFIPFMPTLTVVGRAAGFRELRKSLSFPVQTDCNGYPVGHALYKARPCVCTTPNSVWNPTMEACEVCDRGRAVPTINPTTGAMTAPSGYIIITPIPAWGRVEQFCACPNGPTCKQRHGGNATTHMQSCLCTCIPPVGPPWMLESDPANNHFEQCNPCVGVPPPANPIAGVNVPPITFSGYTPVEVNGATQCRCNKSDGSGGLTTADCQQLFGPRGAEVVADQAGCRCVCNGTNCSTSGQATWTPRPNMTPGPGQPNLWWWNPYHSSFGCNCFCGDGNNGAPSPDRTFNPGSGNCECNSPCPGNQVRGVNDACNPSTCRCPTNGPVVCPPGTILSDADTSCTTCIPTEGGGNG